MSLCTHGRFIIVYNYDGARTAEVEAFSRDDVMFYDFKFRTSNARLWRNEGIWQLHSGKKISTELVAALGAGIDATGK